MTRSTESPALQAFSYVLHKKWQGKIFDITGKYFQGTGNEVVLEPARFQIGSIMVVGRIMSITFVGMLGSVLEGLR